MLAAVRNRMKLLATFRNVAQQQVVEARRQRA